jgi:hypothetical protein
MCSKTPPQLRFRWRRLLALASLPLSRRAATPRQSLSRLLSSASRHYLEHLKDADADTLLVSLSDKLHNVRTLLLDFRTGGPNVFERFNLSREETLWYYSALADTYCARRPGALADELRRVVTDLCLEVTTFHRSDPNSERFVSKLSDLAIWDKDGNLKWKQGVRYVDGRPFTGTLEGQRFEEGIPQNH